MSKLTSRVVEKPKVKPTSYDRAIVFGIIVMLLSLAGFLMGWRLQRLVELLPRV